MSAMRSSEFADAMCRTLQRPWLVGLPVDGGPVRGGVVGTRLDLFAWREAVEPGVDSCSCLAGARCVPQHDREEVVGSQRAEPQLAARTDGRSPTTASEQRDLAQTLSRTEAGDDTSV